jgi:uncharacterized spore protein YtfJ
VTWDVQILYNFLKLLKQLRLSPVSNNKQKTTANAGGGGGGVGGGTRPTMMCHIGAADGGVSLNQFAQTHGVDKTSELIRQAINFQTQYPQYFKQNEQGKSTANTERASEAKEYVRFCLCLVCNANRQR